MARKSKDFKDLMKQKQSSQEKHKNLEALREKMQGGVFGELAANIPIEPKGAIKMSDVLKQFVDPYLHTVHNLKQCKALLSLGVVAWNASLLSESGITVPNRENCTLRLKALSIKDLSDTCFP
ncbi:MAG: hypothetical protein ACK4YK_04150 [Dolichospermum sp.]|jgi:hypothetical protein